MKNTKMSKKDCEQCSISKAIMNIAFFIACLKIKKELEEKTVDKSTAEVALDLLKSSKEDG